MTEGKFSFNGKSLFLTYKTHITEKQLKVLGQDCKYDAVHELSDKDDPYPHTHIQIFFNKRKHIRNNRKFDIGKIHPNWKPIRTQSHWRNVTEYIRKQNKPFVTLLTGNEWEYLGTLKTLIQGKRKWGDVINDDFITNNIKNHMQWAKEVFQNKPKPKLFRHKKLLQWQEKIMKELYEQNDREIIWVVSKKGNIGKTQLSKKLIDEGCFYTRGGKMNDITYRYGEEDIVVMDLVRSQEEYTPYKLIETFKDGIIESNKYMSCLKYPPNGYCKIIVLANYFPNQNEISIDRWRIYNIESKEDSLIEKDGEVKVVPRVLNIINGLEESDDRNNNELFSMSPPGTVPYGYGDNVVMEDYG